MEEGLKPWFQKATRYHKRTAYHDFEGKAQFFELPTPGLPNNAGNTSLERIQAVSDIADVTFAEQDDQRLTVDVRLNAFDAMGTERMAGIAE